mmetsp:Transcript_8968/g.12342  ORF Transcript_8968/g.12342 Transcript_8968/m.12342 type:complete len:279 (+) Transcript_8968:18-854(+)
MDRSLFMVSLLQSQNWFFCQSVEDVCKANTSSNQSLLNDWQIGVIIFLVDDADISVHGVVVAVVLHDLVGLVGPIDWISRFRVALDCFLGHHPKKLLSGFVQIRTPFADDLSIPNRVQVSLASKEQHISRVSSFVFSIAGMHGLMNVSSIVNQELQSTGFSILVKVALLGMGLFLLKNCSVVVDGLDNAESRAVRPFETRCTLREVHIVAWLTPGTCRGVIVVVGQRSKVGKCISSSHDVHNLFGIFGKQALCNVCNKLMTFRSPCKNLTGEESTHKE